MGIDKNKKFSSSLRSESIIQFAGHADFNKIRILKENDYYVKDVPLDGEAPKQYIQAYYYYKNCPRRDRPNNWHGFFAKFGSKSYPHESIIEFIINKIGDAIGLNMNKTQLILANNQVRFLSQNFLQKNQKLIHAIEIIGEYFEDAEFAKEIDNDRKARRKYLTFELIEKAIGFVYPVEAEEILKQLIRMIVFDAIVGNNDRHYYNWGLIGNIKKKSKLRPIFAPIYDSARGLLWNIVNTKVHEMWKQNLSDKKLLDSFIRKSKPRISYGDNPSADHFELVNFLVTYNPKYRLIVKDLVTYNNRDKVLMCAEQYFGMYFAGKRKELTLSLLSRRFDELFKVIENERSI